MSNLHRGHSIDDSYQGLVVAMFANRSGHFVMIHYQTWPPQAILVSDWLIFKNFSSETALPNEPKLGRKHLWNVL
jgi:hypothetical protein